VRDAAFPLSTRGRGGGVNARGPGAPPGRGAPPPPITHAALAEPGELRAGLRAAFGRSLGAADHRDSRHLDQAEVALHPGDEKPELRAPGPPVRSAGQLRGGGLRDLSISEKVDPRLVGQGRAETHRPRPRARRRRGGGGGGPHPSDVQDAPVEPRREPCTRHERHRGGDHGARRRHRSTGRGEAEVAPAHAERSAQSLAPRPARYSRARLETPYGVSCRVEIGHVG